MLEHARNQGNFSADSGWRAKFEEFSSTNFDRRKPLLLIFEDPEFSERMNFIFTKNPKMSPRVFSEATKQIILSIKQIRSNEYILKQFGKLIGSQNDEYFENVETTISEKLYLEEKITKIEKMFDGQFICYSCALSVKNQNELLTHLNSKHKDILSVEQIFQVHKERELRATKRAIDACKRIHNLNHDDCNVCNFPLPEE